MKNNMKTDKTIKTIKKTKDPKPNNKTYYTNL